MKTLLLILVVAIMAINTGPSYGQDESTTEKYARLWVGYFTVSGPETHSGPSVYVSFPLFDTKLFAGYFGKSITSGKHESRGGFITVSKLLNAPTDNPRYRGDITASYSTENLVGSEVLPHKQLAITAGASVVYDVGKFSFKIHAGVGYVGMVQLPEFSLFRPEKSDVGTTFGVHLTYKF